MTRKTKKCPYCGATNVVKRGLRNRTQRWWCRTCNKRFVRHKDHSKDIVIDYVFHKQTVRELAVTYKKDGRTLQKIIDGYEVPDKVHKPRGLHLLVDALRFGSREFDTEWCTVLFRDSLTKENIWWTFGAEETGSLYYEGKTCIETLGYTILSVTSDGFSGIRSSFLNIPFQMCHIFIWRD